MKRPRTKCPYCGHKKAITPTGRIWWHRDKGKPCGGAGHLVRVPPP